MSYLQIQEIKQNDYTKTFANLFSWEFSMVSELVVSVYKT